MIDHRPTLELPPDPLASIRPSLPENIRADRLVACGECGARIGAPCLETPPNISHFGRRLRRMIELGVLASERT